MPKTDMTTKLMIMAIGIRLATTKPVLIPRVISITAGGLILAYALHTFLTGNLWMMTTIPIVSYAIFRYIFLVYSENIGGEPEVIFKDKGMVISIIVWIVSSIAILYDVPAGISKLLGY